MQVNGLTSKYVTDYCPVKKMVELDKLTCHTVNPSTCLPIPPACKYNIITQNEITRIYIIVQHSVCGRLW